MLFRENFPFSTFTNPLYYSTPQTLTSEHASAEHLDPHSASFIKKLTEWKHFDWTSYNPLLTSAKLCPSWEEHQLKSSIWAHKEATRPRRVELLLSYSIGKASRSRLLSQVVRTSSSLFLPQLFKFQTLFVVSLVRLKVALIELRVFFLSSRRFWQALFCEILKATT